MKRSTRNLLVWAGVLGTLAAVPVVFMMWMAAAYAIDGSKSTDPHETAAHAIEAGTFVQYVHIVPDTLRTAWGNLPVDRGWIHEDTHLGYRWLVRPYTVREGTYRLCFTLAEEDGEPAPGDDPLKQDRSRWLVDVETGLRFGSRSTIGGPWRYCRAVERPFPARVSVQLVEQDSLAARMQKFVGAVHPPAPRGTRHLAREATSAGGREMLLTRTEWNGLPMLWISEREPADGGAERWRVRRVMELPEQPLNYLLRFGNCARGGEPPRGTLILEGGNEGRNINSAWRVDAASADLVPVPVEGLTCGPTRRF